MNKNLIYIVCFSVLFLVSCKIDIMEFRWAEYTPGSDLPSARSGHTTSYIDNKRVILFGGYDGSQYLQDTWVYDDNTKNWTNYTANSETLPPARSGHSACYVGSNRVILFGGYDGSQYLQDTWEYNIVTNMWTEYTPEDINPPARTDSAMAFAGDGKIVLFGGKYFVENEGDDFFQDTWIFDVMGHTWTECVSSDVNPPTRAGHAMAYAGDGKIVLFGGDIENVGMSNDTYEFDLSTKQWTAISIKDPPTKRIDHSMAYIGDGIVLMFGGYGGYTSTQYMSDTRYYDITNKNWLSAQITNDEPAKRKKHSLSYIGDGSIMLFGGMAEDETLLAGLWICSSLETLSDKMTFRSDVPILSVNTTSITFDKILINQTTQSEMTLLNSGTGDFDWTAVSDVAWAEPLSSTGNLGASPVTLTLNLDSSSLPIGRHEGILTIGSTNTDVQGVPRDIAMTADIGGVWTEHQPGSSPSARFAHSTAYLSDGNSVLFGGYGYNGFDYGALNDTYEYNSDTQTWTDYTPSSPPAGYPSIRQYHQVAFIGGGKALLFGGYDGSSSLGDTYEYDTQSHTWTNYDGGVESPGGRYSYGLAYGGNEKALLFGGYNGTAHLNDTYEYDAVSHTWTDYTDLSQSPSDREAHAMCFLGGDKVLLFGGLRVGDDGWENLNDTWVYDMTSHTWTEITPDSSIPLGSYSHSMAYIGGGKAVMFGKDNDNVWIFDRERELWLTFTLSVPPSERRYASMCFVGGGKVAVFGGDSTSLGSLDDVWEYYGGELNNEITRQNKYN